MKTYRFIYVLPVLIFTIISLKVQAQDTLVFNAGNINVVKIREIGLDEIKYVSYPESEGPVYVVEKTALRKIILQSGAIIILSKDFTDLTPDSIAIKKIHAVKFEFFSPLTNDLAFGYEQLFHKGLSLEIKLGIIGVGLSENQKPASGLFLKAGTKFLTTPEFYARGTKRSHPLRGGYVKPSLIISHYKVRQDYFSFLNGQILSTDEIAYTNYAIELVFGKQYILGDLITLDYYVGFGYGLQTSNAHDPLFPLNDFIYDPYAYSHIYLGRNFPLTMSGGLTVGYIF